jgi:hypothetical protein
VCGGDDVLLRFEIARNTTLFALELDEAHAAPAAQLKSDDPRTAVISASASAAAAAAVAAAAAACPPAPVGYTLYPEHCVGGPGKLCSGELLTGLNSYGR